MDYRCSICDDLYPHVYPDSMEICATCFDKNFSGAQPSLDAPTPAVREALDAYVDVAGSPPITPRQRAAMAHLQAQWRRSLEDD